MHGSSVHVLKSSSSSKNVHGSNVHVLKSSSSKNVHCSNVHVLKKVVVVVVVRMCMVAVCIFG